MIKRYLSLGLGLVWAVNQLLLAMLASPDATVRGIAAQSLASGQWALYSCISINSGGSPATPFTFDACQSAIGPPPPITLPGIATTGGAPAPGPGKGHRR